MTRKAAPRGRPVATIKCPGLAAAMRARFAGPTEAAASLGRVSRQRFSRWVAHGEAPKAMLEHIARTWEMPLEDLTREPEPLPMPTGPTKRQAIEHLLATLELLGARIKGRVELPDDADEPL